MKRFVSLLAAFALSLSLAGCAQSNSAAGGAQAQTQAEAQQQSFEPRLDTQAQVEFDIVGALNNFEALEAVINDFNEVYPNCTVNYRTLENYKSNIEARVLSDPAVGIFLMNNDLYRIDGLANMCADLSQEDIDLGAVQESAISASTVDGKIFGLPVACTTNGIAVNETLLAKEGLAVPTNYSEFKNVCAALKQKGYLPIQSYTSISEGHWDISYLFPALVKNMVYVQIGNSGREDEILAEFENAAPGCGEVLRGAFERLHEMAENGYISNETSAEFEDSYNGTIMRFFEGDIPFVTMNSETFSGTKKRETKSEAFAAAPFEYSFICAPVGDEGAYAYIENWRSFSVNKNCPQKEWAIEFIRFLATEQELNTLASIKGMPSAAKNSSDERFAGIYPANEDYLYMSSIFIPIWVENAMNDVMNRIGVGELTVDEAVAEFETALVKYKQLAEG